MSRFNPQFSVTPARADYSGIERGMSAIGQGIYEYSRQKAAKEQEEQYKKQMDMVAEFLPKASEKYADKDTGLININKAMGDTSLKGLDPSLLQGARENLEQVNEFMGQKNKADAETAAAHYAQDPSKSPASFLQMNPGAVQQGYAQGTKSKLDMQNTQSLTNQREREQRVQGAQAQYETMDASPIEFMQRNPEELMQAYGQAQDAKAERESKQLSNEQKRRDAEKVKNLFSSPDQAIAAAVDNASRSGLTLSGVSVQQNSDGQFSYQMSVKPGDEETEGMFQFTGPNGKPYQIEVVRDANGNPKEKRTGVPLKDLIKIGDFNQSVVNPAIAAAYGFTDTFIGEAAAPQASQEPVTITSKEEYENLKPGTPYIWNGRSAVKN